MTGNKKGDKANWRKATFIRHLSKEDISKNAQAHDHSHAHEHHEGCGH
jgi:hypothetical protein